MSWRGILMLVLLAGAVFSGWSVWTHHQSRTAAALVSGRSDYVLRNFELISLDKTGKESFTVRAPESKWVARNLLEGMHAEPHAGGIRVTLATSGLDRLARYVVALGAAARAETRELARAVGTIARGALEAATEAEAALADDAS